MHLGFLKGMQFTIACFIVGSIFLLLGLIDGISTNYFTLPVIGLFPKIILCIIGIGAMILAVFIEVKSKTPIHSQNVNRANLKDPFLKSLAIYKNPSVSEMMVNCSQFSILGRTAVNLLNQNQSDFENLSRNNCAVRIVLLNPLSPSKQYISIDGRDWYTSSMISTLTHIEDLHSRGHKNIIVKFIDSVPSFSMICADKKIVNESKIKVQLYFLHTLKGHDLPYFNLSHQDTWYAKFHDEFEKIWNAAKAISLAELKDKLMEKSHAI